MAEHDKSRLAFPLLKSLGALNKAEQAKQDKLVKESLENASIDKAGPSKTNPRPTTPIQVVTHNSAPSFIDVVNPAELDL